MSLILIEIDISKVLVLLHRWNNLRGDWYIP